MASNSFTFNIMMRIVNVLTNSLALALPFLRLIVAQNVCVGGQFRLRIYTTDCEGVSVKTKIEGQDDPEITGCGERYWGSEAAGRDGFSMLGEVAIDRAEILKSKTFWLYQGPKDDPWQHETECTLTMQEDPCVRNLGWRIGFGLDYAGHGEGVGYNLRGGDTLVLACGGDFDVGTPLNPFPNATAWN